MQDQGINPGTRMKASALKHYRSGLLLYVAAATAIAALFSFYYIFKQRAFAFVDIGSDLFFQFFPFQVAGVRQLHELHDVTWSFNIGLGAYLGLDFDLT